MQVLDKSRYEQAYANFMNDCFADSQGNWVEFFKEGNVRVWEGDPRDRKFYNVYGALMPVANNEQEMRNRFDKYTYFHPFP